MSAQLAALPQKPSPCDNQTNPTASVSARFFIVADADPGMLPRLLEAFAKLGEVPTRCHASRDGGDGSQLTVDLRGDALAPRTAELIDFGLRRVLGVHKLVAVIEPQA
jgi:hypothetical protein